MLFKKKNDLIFYPNCGNITEMSKKLPHAQGDRVLIVSTHLFTATDLTNEPAPAKLEEERSEATPDSSSSGASAGPEGLLARLDALDCAVTPPHLSGCSPQQLFDVHEHLTLLMRRVMSEMQSRLAPANEQP